MDVSVERERERQQQRNADRLRELAMKNRVREDVERKRVVDPRERTVDRVLIPERGGLMDKERGPERPAMMERATVGDREPKAVVPLGRLLDRDGRNVERDLVRDVSLLERVAGQERVRGLVREREDERPTERIRQPDRDATGDERVVDRDIEREEAMRELVSSYKSALAELSFNSKPIITNLTIIAGENSHAAKGISSTVFNHIMEVPKEQKLPSLYLLDSIVKNIGGEYIKYFAARLPEVFCTAYRQVDPTTNPAMQHLFRTWRGVFPPAPLRLIENELQISSSAPNGPSGAIPPARPAETPIPRSVQESPIPRTGHGIHVNPKYLEAQRQRLQQTGQADTVALDGNGSAVVREPEGSSLRESSKEWSETQLKRPLMPSRGKRDEYTESSFGRDSQFDFEYDDYGPNNVRKSAPGRSGERDEGWEPGYFRDGEGEGFGHEEGRSPRPHYGPRNGYNWRQPPSRSTDIDGYGYNRGPGPGRGGFFRPLQNSRPDGSGRGPADNWLKTDEEEYVWEDMSPRLRPPQTRGDERSSDGVSKDSWYPGESARGILASETGRLKRTSQDAGFGDYSTWRRDGPGGPMDQTRRPPKDYEVRRSMQSSVGRESGISAMDQSSVAARVPILGARPNVGWPTLGISTRNLSPPARTRPGSLQLSAPNSTISPTARASANLLARAATPPTPSNGVGPVHNSGHFESQQTSRVNIGNFGGGSPSFNSGLSPVTPASGVSFAQRHQPHRRPPSPTQSSPHRSHHQLIPSLASSQLQTQQSHLQLQHEQSNHSHLGRHQIQVSSQLQSSQPTPLAPQSLSLQQVPALLQGAQQLHQQPLQLGSTSQGQAVQQSSQITGVQQSQQLSSAHQAQVPPHQPQLHQPQAQLQQQVHRLQAPLLPLISSQLAQSLQQLAQQQQVQQSQQVLAPQKQPQTSQALGILPQSSTAAANGPSPGSVQVSESQTANSSLLAALLQSGLMPPSQSAQALPQLQSLASRASASLQPNPTQSGFQGQPPLPSGPPPGQFSNSMITGVPGQITSTVSTSLNQMTPFTAQPSRYTQPPLPPGPPPAATIVGSGAPTTSAPPGGVLSSSISSLLSSLVAHGFIAPVQKSSMSAPSSAISGMTAQPNANPGFAPIPPTSVSQPSTTNTPMLLPTVVVSSVPSSMVSIHDSLPSAPKPRKEALNTEFKQELLRERHEFVIQALYSDFPRQCKTCGLRFKAQDEHSKHMDWHVSRNRRQKPPKKISRKWFVSVKEWLSGTSVAASEYAPSFFTEEPGVPEEDHELVAVPADEDQSACALCGELFEDFYSDETDEWMYKGAVYLNVPHGGNTEGLKISDLGPIVHMKCKTESAENVTVDSVEDDDEVQPELQAADSVRMEVDGLAEDIMPLLTENFDLSEPKEEPEELGRRKRTRY